MLKSIFSFMLIGTLLFSSNPIENIGGNKATADEVSQSVVTLDEVFVSESGMLADAEDGEYVGIPAKAFEPRQTFEGITIDDSNKMKDVDGEEIGTYSDQLTGKVSEEELAAPRALLHLRGTDDSAQQDIELNDFRAVVRSGAVLNADGDYVWTAPNSNKDHAFTYRIIFSTSGAGEFAPGQIQITVRKTILRDRNGEYADAYDVAVPEENEEGLTDDNPFVYRVAGDNIVIYNRLGYSMTGKTNYIEVTYRTSKSTFEYADYKSTTSANPNPKAGSDPFQASIEINRGDVHLSGESASVPVYIDTTANLTKAVKKTPTPYESWNSSWGEEVKPDDPEDYYYLIWEINTELTANQPCDLICNDTFNEHDAALLGYSGARNNFKASDTFTNVRSDKTIYVLTAHNKAVYDGILENDLSFTLKNNVKMTLRPVDLVDAASVQTAAAQYKKETARFEVPHYNFFHDTWGYDSADRYYYKSVNNGDTTTWNNTNSDYIRDYSLTEFSEDPSATIDNLKYFTMSGGRPYKFTLPDGVSEAQAAQDPARYYGQKPVKYRLTNRDYYIKEISEANYSGKLSANDYELQKLELYYKFESATYNEATKKFDTHYLTSFSPSDVITVYAEQNCNGNFIKIADYDLSTKRMSFTDAANDIVDIGRSSGITIIFNSNVTGYRLETSNAYWRTEMGAYSYVRLKHSQTVDSYVRKAIKGNDVTKLDLKDSSDSVVYVSNSPVCPLNRYTADFITGKVKKSELRKSYAGSTNNKKKKEYTVTWSASASETYTDNEGTHASPQSSGVFYDLLPDGATFKNDSLKVYAGSTVLDPWKYTVTVDDNYKGSGRTLLTVRINQPGDNYRLYYSTIHPWDAFVDFGKVLRNTVAYETGNLSIANGKTKDDTSDIDESALMKNLDPSAGSSKRFLYTQSTYTADFPVYAELGLEKKVKSENDPSYSNSARVYSKDSYSYNVRFATDDKTKAKDLIAFDSLENYTVGSGTSAERSSDWHGVFRGIDTHYLTSIGIAPKIYYSTTPELIIKDENENIDNTNLSDRNIWTPSDSFTGDLSTVKAIAVDMRTDVNGRPFVLGPDESIRFTVYVTAPNGTESEELYPKAFNGVYLNNNIIDVDSGIESGEMLVHQEYTEVTMTVSADLELLKVCREDNNTVVPDAVFELKGTSDYGTVVDETLCTDSNGRISRKNLERGTYTLKEIKSTNDFFINDTEFTVVIDKNGTLTINGITDVDPFVIEDPRRVHGKFEFLKRGKIDGTTDTVLLDNAKFKIEGTSDYGNPIILYGTSQDGGVVTFPDVEKGIYELTETHADGYITFKEKYQVVCDEYGVVTLQHFEDGAWAEVTDIENGYPVILDEPLHILRIVKYDPLNNQLLNGAKFHLYGSSDYGTYVDVTKISDTVDSKDGVVLFEDLEPGHYILKEEEAPAHYQPDNTLREVTITPEGEITVTGLTKMPSDWQGGFYADCFGVPNKRAYEGEITITKRWLDEDGNPITDSSDLPIPVVHVDTSEPVIDLPQDDAYLDYDKTRDFLSGATTFKKSTLTKPPAGAIKVDDSETRKTRASIYAWKEGTNAYWWTDAVKAHLPDDCSSLFNGMTTLTDVDLSGFDTSNVTDMSSMFDGCSSLITLDVSSFDTVNVTDMNSMFSGCSSLTSDGLKFGDKFDTANVQNMGSMFKGCISLTTLDLSGWDTGNVQNMSYMFSADSPSNGMGLNTLNLSGWDTGSVEDMSYMFSYCRNLTTLEGISGLDTGNVENMSHMFSECINLTTLDLHTWNVDNVKDMSHMFAGEYYSGPITYGLYYMGLTTLNLSGWDTGSVEDMSYMFGYCSSLTTLDLGDHFDTGNVTDMSYMFNRCSSLTALEVVSGFDTGNVTGMSHMFEQCASLTTLNLSGWDTGKVFSMNSMFELSYRLESLNLSGWDTGSLTNTYDMFGRCSGLTELDLSGWNTYNVTDMMNMFADCTSLKTVYVGDFWSTYNAEYSSRMFRDCSSLVGGAGTHWNSNNPTDKTYARVDKGTAEPGYFTYKEYVTPNENEEDAYLANHDIFRKFLSDATTFKKTDVNYTRSALPEGAVRVDDRRTRASIYAWKEGTNAYWWTDAVRAHLPNNSSYLFAKNRRLTNVDLSGFDTSNVTYMSYMFQNCSSLTSDGLKLGDHFDTGKVSDMKYMFDNCTSLTTLDLSSFNTGSVTYMSYMFSGCSNLKTVYVGDLWSTEKVTYSYSMFTNCYALKGGAGTTYNSSYRDKTYARVDNPPDEPGYFTYKEYVPPTGNKDDEPLGATLNNVLGGLINKLVSAVFGDSSAENSQAAPEIQTVKKPEMMAAGRPLIPAALDIKSDGALGAGDGTDTNTVTFSQITNSEVTRNSDDAEGKWLDNGDGTWTYKMKVFDADAQYYIWEEPIPGFKCDLDNDTGYTVINYPSQKNATITNTRTITDTCSLTLKKVLTGNASDYPEYDLAGMDYHFNVKLTGEGVAGEKIFGYTKFTDGEATVTLKAGEQMTFTNIPRGVTYTVTEQEENYQGVFDTTYSPSGKLTADNSDVTFTVTNAIKPVTKSFDITKHVLPYDNGELDAEDTGRMFTFNVDLHADINGLFGDLIFTGGTATAYLKHDETVSITGLPGTVETYTVTEVQNSLYTCDQPAQSGTLTVGETAHVVFNNTKIPEEEREFGGFTITKTVNGKSTDAKFSFNVSMQNLDKNAVYTLSGGTSFTSDINGSANLTIQLAHGESVKFSDLPVDTVYTVSEQACGYYASYTISGTDRVTPLTYKNTVTDRQLATSAITVQKDDDITIAFTNTDKRYDVRIAKVDDDDEFVTDAVLQIIEKGNEENVLDEWVTTEDYHTAQIPQGTYILREKQAPFGYRKADDIEFTVSANGDITINGETVYMIKMVDEPVKLSVTGAGGIYPVITAFAITFTMLLLAVVIKKRSFKNKKKKRRMNMKKLSKVFALMLAVIMIAAMTTVAFAATSSATGSVTVEKAVVGETVKFYRVLDYVDSTGSYAVTDSFKPFFTAKSYTTNDEIIAYLAGVADGADSQALAVEMGTFVKNNNIAAAAEKVADAASFTVTDMPYGYYLMAPSLPGNTDDAIIFSLGKLENANVTITNKLSVPTPEKTVSDSDETNAKSNIAAIDEEMTFTVTGKVPNMSEYTTYYFEIADTMTNMEYVAGSMALTIGGTTVDISTTDSTANVYGVASGNSVKVKITDLKSITAAAYDAEIKLEYNAKLTSSAVMGNTGNKNEVKFVYSNDPATTGKGESPKSYTKTFTLGITVNKTDSAGNALTGSKWLLEKGNDTVAEIDGTTLSKFDWKGLDVGTYTLTEIAAPENYTKMEGKITIEIEASVSDQADDTDGTYPLTTYNATVTGPQGYVTMTNESGYADIQTGITSLNVKNFQNGELPSTGGIGLYVILGLAGAAFAGMIVVLIIKKRLSSKEK